MELLINQSIGDYGILREIGSGGMGRVYEAIHSVTHRHEAIKVLDVNAPTSEMQSERFLREIRLQAALNHPNIAAVHNAFWNEDSLVLVCELLEGESLQTLLERGRLSLTRSTAIVSQVLSALSYAHARGVIHRDVSPANIFVTAASGAVKLIDFGLAKTTSDLNLTQAGTLAGSYHYMSPEHVRGGQSLDARVDIYSCGAVLYELATGRKLFEDDSAFALMQAQCERLPDAPRSLNPDIPRELEEVILKALAKNPDDRFQSAETFARALDQVPTEVAVPAALPQDGRSNARSYAIGLGLAVAVAAAGIVYPALRPRASAASVPAARQATPLAVTTPPAPVAVLPKSTAPNASIPQKPAVTASSTRPAAPSTRKPGTLVASTNQTAPTTELAEVPLPSTAAEPAPLAPTPESVEQSKPTGKVTKAIKWLNPFRGKRDGKPAAEGK